MNYFKKTVFLLVFCAFSASFLFAQTFAQPRQEKLLNGLKILIFNEPKAEKVSLRLRIHSGSAFDPKNKMGVMALLSEILFPDEQTKIFFREDLQGSLDVTSNYDFIQINASGKPDEFLTILETVATAINNPQITPENFTKVRDAQVKKVEELQKNPAYVADMAVAKRLFGDFPYGRPADGTPESLKLIDRADLLFAKDRFFTADNATLAISGSVKPDFAYMAARRLFGALKKSDKLVPATFRQPDEPNAEKLTIELVNLDKSYLRTANNAPARNDKDFYTSLLVVDILQSRLCAKPNYQAHLLRGVFTISDEAKLNELPMGSSRCDLILGDRNGKISLPQIKLEELDKAKSKRLSEITNNPIDLWLDVDTFKLASVKDEFQRLNSVTLTEVQRITENLFKTPAVSVVVTKQAEK